MKRRVLDSSGEGGVARPRRHEEACRPPRRKASARSEKKRSLIHFTPIKNDFGCFRSLFKFWENN